MIRSITLNICYWAGNAGTKYTISLNESYLHNKVQYFNSVSFITMLDKLWTNPENFMAILYCNKKVKGEETSKK